MTDFDPSLSPPVLTPHPIPGLTRILVENVDFWGSGDVLGIFKPQESTRLGPEMILEVQTSIPLKKLNVCYFWAILTDILPFVAHLRRKRSHSGVFCTGSGVCRVDFCDARDLQNPSFRRRKRYFGRFGKTDFLTDFDPF